jgi:tetratricopeptide (TPR) repeat protein
MTCPEPETFSAFVGGSLAEPARDALEAHVDTCTSCRVTLSELGRGVAPLPAVDEHVGRYAIAGELGAGAMGIVYRARDLELDREVAIKLVQPQAGAPEQELVHQRMLREGRALARIDHPNVVRVFDVGRWQGALFVAMEHAPGRSLRVWLQTERTQAAIVDVFVQCARGLAAAHAAGVIHRDFKPENVVVDDRGHARVMDFGLAQTDADVDEVATTPARFAVDPAELRLTRTRGVLGTPAYMAPEQHRGEAIDARADQFAWAVALALGGRRPFTAASHDELLAAMRTPPALPANLPRRVRRVLERALAFSPSDRFPTMTAAIAALTPRRIWPWLAAGAGALVIAGALFSMRERDPCGEIDAAIDRVWTDARGDRIAAQFAAVQRPFADRAWTYARTAVGRYAEDWKTARVGVCRAGVERGELDAATRARVVHCLERRVVELDAILARWETGGLDSAPQMIDRLAPAARCTTSDAAPPATAAELTQLRAFEARFAAAIVAADAGQPLEAEPLLVALEGELAATPHHGLRAEVLTRLAGVARDLGKRDAARTYLVSALAVAETARADRTRARAWISLAANAADDFSRIAEARDSLRLASAVLANLGEPADLARIHDATRGLVALRANETAEAVAALRRSLEITLPPTEQATRIQMLARALIAAGDIPGALAELERAEKILVGALGPDAPQLVFVLNSLMEPLEYLGRVDEGIARGERAVALLETHYGKTNPRRSQALGNLATMYARAGNKTKARTLEEEVLADSIRQFGADSQQAASSHLNLASTLHELGEDVKSIEHLERAKIIYTKVLGPNAAPMANVETSLYEAHTTLGHLAEALAHAERALAIREAIETPPGYLAYTRILVADALLATGDKQRAIAMGKRAAELPLGDTGREGELKQKIGAWLAQHAKPPR